MPDLLAHALIAYAVGTLLSWRYDWLSPTYVTVVMAGAFIPDLAKADLAVEAETVAALLGVPFDWFALHTAGGVLLSIGIGVTVVAGEERRRVAVLLTLGALTHLLADALLLKPSGYAYPILWPLTRFHPPSPGLYLSTEPWPMVVAGIVAGLVWGATRRHDRSERSHTPRSR